jgi:DNA-binding MarR family transcriptional regulator
MAGKKRTDRHRVAHLIGRVDYRIKRFLAEELNNHRMEGLAPSHGDIIGTLLIKDHLSMKELAAAINKDKSTVTGLIEKLIVLGYVRKSTDGDDNRFNIISLTEKGRALRSEWQDISSRLVKRVCTGLTESEIDSLIKALLVIEENF